MCAMEDRDKPDEFDGSSPASSPAPVDKSQLLSGFRNTQRVAFETPVDVYISVENEQAFVEHAKTLNVSASGALVVLTTPIKLGQQLVLSNPKTNKKIECHVRRNILSVSGDRAQVGVQFVVAMPGFWDIASAPADWDPSWVPPPQQLNLDMDLLLEPTPQPAETQEPDAGTAMSNLARDLLQDLAKPRKDSMVAATPKRLRRSTWLILLAAAVTLFALWSTLRNSSNSGPAASLNLSVRGVAAEDAAKIPNFEDLRLAKKQDFDAAAVSWIRDVGQHFGGKIPGLYFGSFESNAYIFVSKTNERRVVIFAGGELRYNAEYPVIAIAARFPKELIRKTTWADSPPPESTGDGLLIVRAVDSPASAVVLFVRSDQIVTASPTDYRQIPYSQAH